MHSVTLMGGGAGQEYSRFFVSTGKAPSTGDFICCKRAGRGHGCCQDQGPVGSGGGCAWPLPYPLAQGPGEQGRRKGENCLGGKLPGAGGCLGHGEAGKRPMEARRAKYRRQACRRREMLRYQRTRRSIRPAQHRPGGMGRPTSRKAPAGDKGKVTHKNGWNEEYLRIARCLRW